MIEAVKDTENINIILATDCGSTTTKAILIEKRGDEYRQTYRGESPTTVEAPFEDVTMGVLNAVTEVSELSGRKLIDENNRIIKPANGNEGCDIFISTSSAGGGLQMMVAGVVKSMTAQSAERAALGAGSIVMDVIASNDKRLPHQQIERIRSLRPDMILLSGGIDGGTKTHVVELAEIIAAARPKPRLGSGYNLPVIYAGNNKAVDDVTGVLAEKSTLSIVENIRPVLETENLGPAREKIHDLFLEHVMQQAPGYNRLMSWTDAPIMPTPGAVGLILRTIAEQGGVNAVGVDIGGATTDIFSVFDTKFNRTVSANLGMSYSVSNVFKEAGYENVMRWVPFEMDERDLRNRVKNKMIRPTSIPQSLQELVLEQAIAKEALRLAFIHHRSFATDLKGVQQQRTIGDTFKEIEEDQSLIKMMGVDLLVASGGVLSHAPSMHQTAMMLIDSFYPEGLTHLAKDSIFMMPHLGVLTQVHKQAATEVFKKDCLIYLGSVLSPRGKVKPGKKCLDIVIALPDGSQITEEVLFGEIKLYPLDTDQTASFEAQPTKGFDCGEGPGNKVTGTFKGGTVGIIIDCRGRPLVLPEEQTERIQILRKWMKAVKIYENLEY